MRGIHFKIWVTSLRGLGEGGRGRRTDESEAAILPLPIAYSTDKRAPTVSHFLSSQTASGKGGRGDEEMGEKEQRASLVETP